MMGFLNIFRSRKTVIILTELPAIIDVIVALAQSYLDDRRLDEQELAVIAAKAAAIAKRMGWA